MIEPSPTAGPAATDTSTLAPPEAELTQVLAIAGAVPDPEIPAVTLADLGILRGATRHAGRIVVFLTPTYTACPATLAIRLAVETALVEAGYPEARVETVLSPPWTTDDITDEGRDKLRAYGIAPPPRGARADKDAPGRGALLFADETVACPRCDSTHTSRLAQFGSTACKALWRCEACREPFDYFKCL